MAESSDFMLKEYENISQAHFKTNESIAIFFRYYLLLMAIPIAFLGTSWEQVEAKDVVNMGSALAAMNAAIFGIFAVMGLCVMYYVIGLRLDALLYARTVNGTRKYFADRGKNSKDKIDDFLVLPTNMSSPKFTASNGFLGLVSSFTILDSCYAIAATFFFNVSSYESRNWNFEGQFLALLFAILVASVVLHIVAFECAKIRMSETWD
ncbi:MAG: hypothetical protein O2971_05715 [Proteobacteria bacterium]|nr:hypothetical protein [Pseudomonadota bacterium]